MKEYRQMLSSLPKATKVMMVVGFGIVALAVGYFLVNLVTGGITTTTNDRSQAKFNRLIVLVVLIAIFAAGSWIKGLFTKKNDDDA